MSSAESLPPIVSPGPELVRAALTLVFADMPESDRGRWIDDLLAEARTNPDKLAGLRAIVVDGRIAGAMWCLREPGRTASLLPPQIAPGQPQSWLTALARAGLEYALENGADMAQTLVDRWARPEWLAGSGFSWLADLEFMALTIEKGSPPSSNPRGSDEEEEYGWEEYHRGNHEPLVKMLDATYVETLDCPGLDSRRRTDHVLDGYLRTGTHIPGWWLILVEPYGRDLGCLLLTDHPDRDQVEVLYMGLDREFRGQGLGKRLIQKAIDLAQKAGRRQLILAVDARNEPAVRLYQSAGFRTWQERSAWVRSFL